MKTIKKIVYQSFNIESVEDVSILEEILYAIQSYQKLLHAYQKAVNLGVTCQFSSFGWRNRLLVNSYEHKVIIETDCGVYNDEMRDDGKTYRVCDVVKTLEALQVKIQEYREKIKTLKNIDRVEMTQEEWSSLDVETSKVLLGFFDVVIEDDVSQDEDED